MKKSSLAKVLLAFVAVFAGCDSADLTKAPVLEREGYDYSLISRDDETVIKDIKAFGRNGECRAVLNTSFKSSFRPFFERNEENYDKYEEYLKASGFEIRRDNDNDALVKCRRKDGSTREIDIERALALKDGTCVYKLDYDRLTFKEYNEFHSKLSETTLQYFSSSLGKPLIYNKALDFWIRDCEPKNGKYEITVKTNFGTFDYEIADR